MAVRTAKPEDFMVRDRIYGVPWGEPKTSKTSFALSGPDPRWVFNFNFGLEALPDSLLKGIYKITNYEFTTLSGPQEYVDGRDYFKDEYFKALAFCAKERGTVVVDLGNQMYDMVLAAGREDVRRGKYANNPRLGPGSSTPLPSLDYGEINSFMHSVTMAPLQHKGVNVFLVHGSKEEWVKDADGRDRPTGRPLLDCWKGIPGAAQIVMQCKKRKGPKSSEFEMVINSCRLDTTQEGETISPTTYEWLAAILRIER